MNILSFSEFVKTEHTDKSKAERMHINDPEKVLFYADDVYIWQRDNEFELMIANHNEISTKSNLLRKLYQYWLEEHTTLYVEPNELHFKGYYNTHTGGGCTALQKDLAQGYNILITDGDCSIPSVTDTQVLLGLYDENGEQVFCAEMYREEVKDLTKILVEWSTATLL